MDEFNDAAEGETPQNNLPQRLMNLVYKVWAKKPEFYQDSIDQIHAAGFYLYCLPLKPDDPEIYWDAAYRIGDLARSCIYDERIEDILLSQLLYAKQVEVLRESLIRFPGHLKNRVYLGEVLAQYNCTGQASYDEGIAIIRESMEFVGPEHEYYDEAQEVLDDILSRPPRLDQATEAESSPKGP